jgi:serpin B
MKKIIVAASAICMMASCSDSEETGKTVDLNVLENQEYTSTIALTRSESETNDALNKFSSDLFGVVSQNYSAIYDDTTDGNFTVSPLGVFLSMGLLANTVDDANSASIAEMFNYTDVSVMNSVCSKLMHYLPYKDNGAEMALANSAWITNSIDIPSDYVKNINSLFNAEVYSTDFTNNQTLDLINSWCSIKTNNKISKVLSKLDPQTIVMLINAMYYEGKWNSSFDKSETYKKEFKGTNGTEKVNMMHKECAMNYVENDDCYGVALPFENAKAEMIFLMPKSSETDIYSFTDSFDHNSFDALKREALSVSLSLPRFEIKQEGLIDAGLQKMGLPCNVFLSKLGVKEESKLRVKQNTYTSIDEDGATATAVTTTIALGSNGQGGSSAVEVNFNRPFVFFIRNVETGTVLMSGRICNI